MLLITISPLGYCGDIKAVTPLEKTLEDKNQKVRKQVTLALLSFDKNVLFNINGDNSLF
jgi:hypothetical protein